MYTPEHGNDLNLNMSRSSIRKLLGENLNTMRFIQNETIRMNREYEHCLYLERMYRAGLRYSYAP